MKFYNVREELLRGKSLFDIPLRVTFYARVSTEKEEQLNSLENQISYFENFIKQNNNWTYVLPYIDEGLSGNTTSKRKNFLRMIEDSKEDIFDLIITKEVSRFSRSLSDSIKYTRKLLENNVGVYFQTNGINTYDPNSEFILNMMASLAQEEVKRLSSRIKWGHKEAMKKGKLLGSTITGYKKKNNHLIIVEEEAKVIREIFFLYVTGKYGLAKLGNVLFDRGITNSKGNPYDKDSLKRIIENPKYKGYYRAHTTEVVDYVTKRRLKIPKEDQLVYKDKNIPIIVEEELWNRANEILQIRSSIMKKNKDSARLIQRKYCYTGRIYCSEDNLVFRRIAGRNNNYSWVCSNYVKYGRERCQSPILREDDLNNIFLIIMQKILGEEEILIKKIIDYYSNNKTNNIVNAQIKRINQEIKNIEIRKERLLDLNIDGIIGYDEFKNRNEKYNDLIKIKNNEIKKISSTSSNSNLYEYIKSKYTYRNTIHKFVSAFLDKMIIYKINGNRHNLNIKVYLKIYDSKIDKSLCDFKYISKSIKREVLRNRYYIEIYYH